MNDRPFRFGVATTLAGTPEDFLATARGAERLGFESLVVADGLWLADPFELLAAASAVTSTLRLGTQVLAAPLRHPVATAHLTQTLDALSNGRFQLGLGVGTPAVAGDAERLGLPFGRHAERLAHIAATLAEVRALFAERERPAPPVLLGGIGPRLVELAVAEADTLTIPVPYDQPVAALESTVAGLRGRFGAGFERLELAINVMVVGDGELPAWVPAELRSLPGESYGRLTGEPRAIADRLRRLREATGISYVTAPQWSMPALAPVIELLAGH